MACTFYTQIWSGNYTMLKTLFYVLLDAQNKKYVAHQEHNKGFNAATTSSWCISRSRKGEQWAWSIYRNWIASRQSEDSVWTKMIHRNVPAQQKESFSIYLYNIVYNIRLCQTALERVGTGELVIHYNFVERSKENSGRGIQGQGIQGCPGS